MRRKMSHVVRWALLIGSGAVVFQNTVGCLDIVQTGLLAFISGVTFFLARNI